LVTTALPTKITTVDNGLYNGSPQTNFAYTLDPGTVWYDLSDTTVGVTVLSLAATGIDTLWPTDARASRVCGTHHDSASGGISLKITTVDNGLYNGSPQTNFAYTLEFLVWLPPGLTPCGQQMLEQAVSVGRTTIVLPENALKITTVDNGLYNGSPQTNFAYTLDPGTVWYDLSCSASL
jgi:hypothetical protein